MKNVTLHYTGTLRKVSTAVNKANEILCSENFYEAIKRYPQFDNSPLNPKIIASIIGESGQRIKVTVNWIIPIVNRSHDRIGLSGWDFSSNLGTGVNTLIYETVYCADCLYDLFYKKSNDKNLGINTAPFLIAAMAEGIVARDPKPQALIQL